jgi:hypothetical protein
MSMDEITLSNKVKKLRYGLLNVGFTSSFVLIQLDQFQGGSFLGRIGGASLDTLAVQQSPISLAGSPNLPERALPQDVQKRLDVWYTSHVTWEVLHYGLGAISIICSFIAAGLGSTRYSTHKAVLSIIAGICAGLLTFLSPSTNAKAYIQAWRHLDSAARQYKSDQEIPIQRLNQAVDDGEKIIEGTPSPRPPNTNK